jgi:hypothetical protein
MNSPRSIATLALVLGLSAASLFAQGRRQQQTGADCWFKIEKEMGLQTRYSVDMEIQAMGMVMPSKTYRLDDLMRSETTMPFMNLKMVVLQLKENGKSVSYALFPDKKKYCLNEGANAAADKVPAYKITEAGTETHEGVACKKRRITVTMDDGQTQDMDMLFSPAQKNMPVKMTATVKAETQPGQPPMEITSVVLFKNYQFAAPAASLFTIPKDYTRSASMQEVMMSSMGGFTAPQQSGQAAGGAGSQDVNALIRQAQQDAAREAAAEEAKQEGQNKAASENLQQNIRSLRSLLGK